MPPLGVRGCPGVVLSALHLLLNRTPPDEVFQALATESGPIPEFRKTIADFERTRIRDVTLLTGIHKEFCHFSCPFLLHAPGRGADARARTPRGCAYRGPCRVPGSVRPLHHYSSVRAPLSPSAPHVGACGKCLTFRVCSCGYPGERKAHAFPTICAEDDARRGWADSVATGPVRNAAALCRSAHVLPSWPSPRPPTTGPVRCPCDIDGGGQRRAMDRAGVHAHLYTRRGEGLSDV